MLDEALVVAGGGDRLTLSPNCFPQAAMTTRLTTAASIILHAALGCCAHSPHPASTTAATRAVNTGSQSACCSSHEHAAADPTQMPGSDACLANSGESNPNPLGSDRCRHVDCKWTASGGVRLVDWLTPSWEVHGFMGAALPSVEGDACSSVRAACCEQVRTPAPPVRLHNQLCTFLI